MTLKLLIFEIYSLIKCHKFLYFSDEDLLQDDILGISAFQSSKVNIFSNISIYTLTENNYYRHNRDHYFIYIWHLIMMCSLTIIQFTVKSKEK